MTLSFDDPKPPREKRKMQQIFLLPSVRERIDRVRGKVSRSEWIEMAVLKELREREGGNHQKAPKEPERPWVTSP